MDGFLLIITLSNTCISKKCTESLIKLLKDIDASQYGAYEDSSFSIGSYNAVSIKIAPAPCKSIIDAISGRLCFFQMIVVNKFYVAKFDRKHLI
ncbi:hypothetical protein H8356DRAFT_1349014 [Neocallimastix lanati (nom. inval.)]|nr:hypothetical protein H8356DRAFT_1349014 [Neocallimastix sp. JGI-2020a]